MVEEISTKKQARLLKFLSDNKTLNTTVAEREFGKIYVIKASSGKTLVAVSALIDDLQSNGLISATNGELEITKAGRAHLRRTAAKTAFSDGFAEQHMEIRRTAIDLAKNTFEVECNQAESPLNRLRTRKTAGGGPWLDETAFQAGERLRRDFTLGGLMQSVTQSWDATTGNASGKSGSHNMNDLTDSVIDSRRRVTIAIQQVGPELAGVLIDVCCYLKGLETVERERRWPPRSAKLMLRAGLELLSRHYGMVAKGKDSAPMRSWNSASNQT